MWYCKNCWGDNWRDGKTKERTESRRIVGVWMFDRLSHCGIFISTCSPQVDSVSLATFASEAQADISQQKIFWSTHPAYWFEQLCQGSRQWFLELCLSRFLLPIWLCNTNIGRQRSAAVHWRFWLEATGVCTAILWSECFQWFMYELCASQFNVSHHRSRFWRPFGDDWYWIGVGAWTYKSQSMYVIQRPSSALNRLYV